MFSFDPDGIADLEATIFGRGRTACRQWPSVLHFNSCGAATLQIFWMTGWQLCGCHGADRRCLGRTTPMAQFG